MDKPQLLREELLLKGLRFNVIRRYYRKANGEEFARDVVAFPEAVAVLPVLDDGSVILLRQFRAPLNDTIIEAPAGVVDPGETPEEAAERELEEETGYHAGRLVRLGSFTPSPGYSSEVIHFYYATRLEYRGAKPERYEVLEPFKTMFQDALAMVHRGVISDMKTALLILLYDHALRGGGVEH
ncbi:NUDIX hydrolase [Desulfurococcus mucosus]|uniref:NUDIX hydrolase n=1 Tax=Desulfurococcus mucosus (strain ATCC 35584 / DSM 2162 / JCM 9187 / O7/1) TaxID=765177 RepID=E8R6X7_DESM0|nr:NUDIX hydrolase [Desulfurococcus mucosus]ADV64410.1 NUDIX hydrolase [Desulfurococcus mucosus DSM 2162]